MMSPKWANMMYVIFITMTVIVSLSLKYSGKDLNIGYEVGMPTSTPSVCVPSPAKDAVVFTPAVPANNCDNLAYDMCNSTSCQGMWAVYRLTFSLAGFFLVMLLLTCTKTSFSTTMHRGFWFGKGLGLTGVVIACLFAPNDLFAGFAWFARIGAPLFVIYQVVCFIDFGYTFSTKVVEKDEREDNFFGLTNHGGKYKGFMLFVCFLLVVAAFAATAVLYSVYPRECAFNNAAVTTSLLFSLINFGITISPIAEHGSILVACLVWCYSTYLAFSAISAFPEPSCNPYVETKEGDTLWLVISVAIAAASIAWMAYQNGARQMGGNAMDGKEQVPTTASNDTVVVRVDPIVGSGAAEAATADSYVSYHLVMFLASLYAAMLVTDWGAESTTTGSTRENLGYPSAWLLLGSMWVCQLIYFWTLIAARACPDRDFS